MHEIARRYGAYRGPYRVSLDGNTEATFPTIKLARRWIEAQAGPQPRCEVKDRTGTVAAVFVRSGDAWRRIRSQWQATHTAGPAARRL